MWLPDPWQSGSSRQRPGCSQDWDLWLKIVRWAGDSGDSVDSGDTWQCRCSLLTWTTSSSAPATAPPPATAACRWPGGTLSSCVVLGPFSSVESFYPPVLVLYNSGHWNASHCCKCLNCFYFAMAVFIQMNYSRDDICSDTEWCVAAVCWGWAGILAYGDMVMGWWQLTIIQTSSPAPHGHIIFRGWSNVTGYRCVGGRFEKFADRHFYHSCNLCKVRGYLVVQLTVSTVSPLAQLFPVLTPLLACPGLSKQSWSPAPASQPKHCEQC